MSEHVCTSPDNLHALFCRIQRVENPDPKKLTELQKQHLPVITAPKESERGQRITIEVEVGKYLAHPNEREHHIQWIEIWQREAFITRIDLTPKFTAPKFSITVTLDHPWPILARARCNLHGIWENQVPFSIKQ